MAGQIITECIARARTDGDIITAILPADVIPYRIVIGGVGIAHLDTETPIPIESVVVEEIVGGVVACTIPPYQKASATVIGHNVVIKLIVCSPTRKQDSGDVCQAKAVIMEIVIPDDIVARTSRAIIAMDSIPRDIIKLVIFNGEPGSGEIDAIGTTLITGVPWVLPHPHVVNFVAAKDNVGGIKAREHPPGIGRTRRARVVAQLIVTDGDIARRSPLVPG